MNGDVYTAAPESCPIDGTVLLHKMHKKPRPQFSWKNTGYMVK